MSGCRWRRLDIDYTVEKKLNAREIGKWGMRKIILKIKLPWPNFNFFDFIRSLIFNRIYQPCRFQYSIFKDWELKGKLWKFWRDYEKNDNSSTFDFDFSRFVRSVDIGFDRMLRFTEKIYDKYIFNHRSLYIYR